MFFCNFDEIGFYALMKLGCNSLFRFHYVRMSRKACYSNIIYLFFGFYEYMDINVRESGIGTKIVSSYYRSFSQPYAKIIAESL